MIGWQQWDEAQEAFDAAQGVYQDCPAAAQRAIDELGDLLAVNAGCGEIE